jgi:hypothetical protein
MRVKIEEIKNYNERGAQKKERERIIKRKG